MTETGTGIVVTRNDIRRRVMSTSDWYFVSVAVADEDGQGVRYRVAIESEGYKCGASDGEDGLIVARERRRTRAR